MRTTTRSAPTASVPVDAKAPRTPPRAPRAAVCSTAKTSDRTTPTHTWSGARFPQAPRTTQLDLAPPIRAKAIERNALASNLLDLVDDSGCRQAPAEHMIDMPQ